MVYFFSYAYVEFESEDLATKYFTSAKGGIKVENGSSKIYVNYATACGSYGQSKFSKSKHM